MARFKSDEWRVLQAVAEGRKTADDVKPDRFSSVVRKLACSGLVDEDRKLTKRGELFAAKHLPNHVVDSEKNGQVPGHKGGRVDRQAKRPTDRRDKDRGKDRPRELEE